MSTSAGDQIVPGYVLGPVIGKGGFAVVYRARQVSLDRDIALKIDSRHVDVDRNARRFLREATAASMISSHPHVVSLIDAGTTGDNRPYLAMELCEGGSVAKLIKSRGPLRPADVNELAIAIASALAAAHENGILHRDIKPANILIDGYGTPRLGDFGLAALPTPGEELSVTLEALTPGFASPETFERATPSEPSDIWSFGATMYAILTGQAPRRNPDGSAPTVTDIIKRLHEPLPAPTHIAYAQPLMNVIWRATATQPEQRPSANELRQMLIALRGRLGPGRDVALLSDVTKIAPDVTSVTTPLSAVSGPTLSSAASPNTGNRLLVSPAATPAKRGTWWVPLAVALAVAAVAIGVAVGLTTNWYGLAGGNGPDGGGVPGGDGTEAVASLPWVAPATGTCYGEMMNGVDGGVGAEAVECRSKHHWESFETGTLDGDVASAELAVVQEHPAVKKACTVAVLGEYTDVSPERITISVLPPTPERFEAGERRFSCIASTGPRVGTIKD